MLGLSADLNDVTQTALGEAQSRMSQSLQRYVSARDKALELGKTGLGTVDSRQELQRQRQVVVDFLHATLKGIQAIRDVEPYVAEKVRAAGFAENRVDSVRRSVRSALDAAGLPKKIRRMRLDMDWTDAMQERYQLLHDDWGKWYRDASDARKIDSKNADFVRKFNALGLKIYQIEKQANRISNALSK